MQPQTIDHVAGGLALLLSQYRERPRLAALLSSFLRRVQELDDATLDVLVSRLLDTATGAQLRVLGRLVGQTNAYGWSDNVYRLFIRARIRANKSNGHGDDVIDVLNLVQDPSFFSLREYYPATMLAEYEGPTTVDPQILMDLVRSAKGAGVKLQLLYTDHYVGVNAFVFVAGTTDEASVTEGFALDDESNGGFLSGVLE
jgi:Protein of unknown function (DUF2612)